MMAVNRCDSLFTGGLAPSPLRRPAAAGTEVAAQSARIRLSLNENPFGPSPQAIAALRDQFGALCRYGRELGDALTQAIASREAVSTDQIVVGEILKPLGSHLAQTGLRGEEYIYSEPGYTALVDAVRPGGGIVVAVPLNRNLENDLEGIAARVNQRTRAIYLVNPHNPSGTVTDAAAFLSFVREISKRAVVIIDEAYLEFDPDFDQRTAAGLVRAGGNVVVVRTFDKLFGLAGLGLGYAIAPTALAASLKRAGIGSAETIDRLSLAAATVSMQDGGYIVATRKKVGEERRKWHQLLQRLGLRHSDARANFVFFETGRPHRDVAAALRARGIEIGRAFPPLEHWARITIGLPQENAAVQAAVAELLRHGISIED